MKKNNPTKEKNKAKTLATKQDRIKSVLKEYKGLAKKNNGEGRRLRRKLRRLGYYLSKHNNKENKKNKK